MKANQVEIVTRLLSGLALIPIFWQPQVCSQTAPSPESQSSPSQQQTVDKARPAETPFLLKMNARLGWIRNGIASSLTMSRWRNNWIESRGREISPR